MTLRLALWHFMTRMLISQWLKILRKGGWGFLVILRISGPNIKRHHQILNHLNFMVHIDILNILLGNTNTCMDTVAAASKGGRPKAVQAIQGKRRNKAQTVSHAYFSLGCTDGQLDPSRRNCHTTNIHQTHLFIKK